MLRVITANVNGIRAALRRGGLDWLAHEDADVLLLQEVRATHEQLHEALQASPLAGMHVTHVPAPQLGRAGVTILTRTAPVAVRERTRVAGLHGLGRWVEAGELPGDDAYAGALVRNVSWYNARGYFGIEVPAWAAAK